MRAYPAWSLVPDTPPGFVHRERLARLDVRRTAFALLAPSLDAAREALAPHLPLRAGLVLTTGETPGWDNLAPGLHHLQVTPACLPTLSATVQPILDLLEQGQTLASDVEEAALALDRAADDRLRLVKEHAGFRQGLLEEIAERRAAEAALRESEQRFRIVFDSVNDVIMVLDAGSGAVLEVNPRACEMLRCTREQVLSAPMGFGSSGVEPYTEALAQDWVCKAAAGEPQVFEWHARDQDGRRFWVEVHLRRAQIGGRGCVLATIRDIDARKQAEAKLLELNQELERRVAERTGRLLHVNRELEAFSYSVSHDLRAPLRVIDGFSAALEEDCGPALGETGRAHLKRVRRACVRMGSLIDAILGLAKLTRCPLHRVRVDLTTLATQVAEEVAANYPGHVVEFVVQPGLAVDADEDLLRVALGNLLDNAWKYTARVARARVEVHGTVEPGQAVFHVKDNGAGFDVTRAVNLFGAFQRYHTSVEFEGNGVGLATVQRIVHRHGGAIWAQSAVDQGATFSFTLGAAQDDPGSP